MPPPSNTRSDDGGNGSGPDASYRPVHEDFEIAVICALPIESSALLYLFDEFFDGDDNPQTLAASDRNHYSTGRIGRHNVVLALLPSIGKAAAAGAAASLRASYCNVRVALLVGICGGVPSAELLLGDVVISNALVQYDLGRRWPGGVFARKNTLQESLGRPNKDIRALLKRLETDRDHDRLERRTAYYLQKLQESYAKRGKKRRSGKYKYPGVDEDELFHADYRHRHRFASCCSDEATCARALESSCDEVGCEESYLILDRENLKEKEDLEKQGPAKAQEPAIYIGPVASGDTVMKSGEDRDLIAREEGIIAFEMEGAGVWDEIPCIVVKGICDYADSHKHKRWQEFAAATAASATKALLETLATVDPASKGVVSHREMLSVLEAFRRQGGIPANGGDYRGLQFSQVLQFATQNHFVCDLKFHSVLVIDARGRYLPFYLETINSKDFFIDVLRFRFRDLGTAKIDRGEWSLEDDKTGDVLDLSQPWQTVVKRGRVLKMRMNFRRRDVPTTQCPSCGFMKEGLPTDQVQCNVCGLTYCRIEEVQDIEVQEERAPTGKTHGDASNNDFPRPRPPLQLPPDDDIRHYKHVRIVETSFRIRKAGGNTGGDQQRSAMLTSHHLQDPEFLAEELSGRFGLSSEDCMRILQESEAQLEALRAEFSARKVLEEANEALLDVSVQSRKFKMADTNPFITLLQLFKPAKDVPDAGVFAGDLDQIQTIAEQEQPKTEPNADTIRGAAAIVRRLSSARMKMEYDELRRMNEEKRREALEPVTEDGPQYEWDGIRRRKTILGSQRGRSMTSPSPFPNLPEEDDAPLPPPHSAHSAKRQFSFQNIFRRHQYHDQGGDGAQEPIRPVSRPPIASRGYTSPLVKGATEEERLGLVKGDTRNSQSVPALQRYDDEDDVSEPSVDDKALRYGPSITHSPPR